MNNYVCEVEWNCYFEDIHPSICIHPNLGSRLFDEINCFSFHVLTLEHQSADVQVLFTTAVSIW